ncbi:uncharacterized protein N7446_009399 [Penicillium canescens]|uniref:Uncharacterized protein n=1 Tax=Penicillium canescens TaxID=5083 RepID=A0AAD6N5N9_PENCN|nr:uncharacterized protein N7446_009399 [Penicillium canescens]KAJ6034645.1 hypothetical protein N7460_008820 [Penicillium canescens]KAJ6046307.1 hypothetical protein N7444_007561 [Penicillium canescens]KAJ6053387.1 hypothetical protein N7446_009399 [Penicillium canescens]
MNRTQVPVLEEASLVFPLSCLLLSFLFTICFYRASFRNVLRAPTQCVARVCQNFLTTVSENGGPFLYQYVLPGTQHLSRVAFVAVIVSLRVFCRLTRYIFSRFYHALVQHQIERIVECVVICYQHLHATHRHNLALAFDHLRASYLYTVHVWYAPYHVAVERFLQICVRCVVHGYQQLKENLNIRETPTIHILDDESDADDERGQEDESVFQNINEDEHLLSPVGQLISQNHQRRPHESSLFVNMSSTASNASSSDSNDLNTLPDPPTPRTLARHIQWNMPTVPQNRRPRLGDFTPDGYTTHNIQTYNRSTQAADIPVWEVEYYERIDGFESMAGVSWINVAIDWFAESVFIVVAPDMVRDEE